jgi:hypothetical protein
MASEAPGGSDDRVVVQNQRKRDRHQDVRHRHRGGSGQIFRESEIILEKERVEHLLLDWEDLDGWAKEARTVGTWFGMHHRALVGRVAIIADDKWAHKVLRITNTSSKRNGAPVCAKRTRRGVRLDPRGLNPACHARAQQTGSPRHLLSPAQFARIRSSAGATR